MTSKWQILKNSIIADLPPIQENKPSFADVVKAVTTKMKKQMHTDHLDTTLPQLETVGNDDSEYDGNVSYPYTIPKSRDPTGTSNPPPIPPMISSSSGDNEISVQSWLLPSDSW